MTYLPFTPNQSIFGNISAVIEDRTMAATNTIKVFFEPALASNTQPNGRTNEKADWIYPAHGKPFKREDLEKYVNHIPKIRLCELK